MTTLNSRLQLAMLNRKKSRNALEKGFTLIELLITVVILGVLSSVAVPGFLAQKNKADITAANAQGKALMAACKAALVDGSQVSGEVNSAKTFGNISWTPNVTQSTGSGATLAPAPVSACASGTTGSSTDQSYVLDIQTGELSTNTDAA